MDEADLGNEIAGKYLKGYMAEALRKISRGPGSEYCEDCGAVIPLPRREAVPGCTRCVKCQQEFEK
jgi:phage/conjugal plasmid C-4 type zinc finger TraR family protein